MKLENLHLIQRPFHEIVDDLLTAIVGGVVNEPIPFDIKSDLYPLAEPAVDIRGITGTRDGQRYTFRKSVDFVFSEGDNAVFWEEGDARPDDNTVFYVDYFRRESRSPITDINVGSVTRILAEATGREIAMVYGQVDQAYRMGFIDTAEGASLDLVVSILGIRRKTADFAMGIATFFRQPGIQGNITIPEGTVISDAPGEVFFETVEPRTLQRGQARIDVPIRAREDSRGESGLVEAGQLTELSAPIAGIQRVTHFEPTILAADNENDAQLRLRAKAVLRALGKATIAALLKAGAESRAGRMEIHDPNTALPFRTPPGQVTLLVEAEPERLPSINAAIQQTRAAGVHTLIVAPYIYFKPRLVARISPGITAPGKEKVAMEIIAAIQKYVDDLSSGDPAEGAELIKAGASVTDVEALRLVDVITWKTDLDRDTGEAFLDGLTEIAQREASDLERLRKALQQHLDSWSSAATPQRSFDRSLLENASGARATDADIENGEFRVSARLGDRAGWVVLDMNAEDIFLEEGVA